MVLDAKALTWAASHEIDTARLKKGRVPIYGKWYFPEIPPDVVLVNLETGEQRVFPERMVAGEVIFVPAADLVRAGLAPAEFSVMEVPWATDAPGRAIRPVAPEPLLAMARPPGYALADDFVADEAPATLGEEDTAALAGIHMPSPSIAPFVLGVGFCITLLGAITNPIILVVGLLWMVAGAIVWIRVGLFEARAAGEAHTAEHPEVEPSA